MLPVEEIAGAEIDKYLDAFESIYHRDGFASLEDFLPGTAHPFYLQILKELVRIDLEYRWDRNEPWSAAMYFEKFPELRVEKTVLHDIAFEEYRQRQLAGQRPSPEEFAARYGITTSHWQISEADPTDAEKPTTRAAERATIGHADQVHYAVRSYHRLKSQSGSAFDSSAWLEEYSQFRSVDFLRELNRLCPGRLDGYSEAIARLPRPGERVFDFEILGELGTGAFGSVFLATQHSLANRPVAIKISPDVLNESQTLAQLQHTNIVPIYSVHRNDVFQAVCMPYLGRATFRHLLRELRQAGTIPSSGRAIVTALDRISSSAENPISRTVKTQAFRDELSEKSYIDAVLLLFTKLVRGLHHAHLSGILHRDLKPANILLTDEAQPMLLDFNLSQDNNYRENATCALVGGTLPYMAPEAIAAFNDGTPSVDPRSDIYSLAVILYEMLTLQLPFPIYEGSTDHVSRRMLEDRIREKYPNPRKLNAAIPPAVAEILRRSLSANVANRYQSTQELIEDLTRHQEHLPLRHGRNVSLKERIHKWRRRHPVAASTTAVMTGAFAVVACLTVLLSMTVSRLSKWEAQQVYQQFQQDLDRARELSYMAMDNPQAPIDADSACRTALSRFHAVLAIGDAVDPAQWQKEPPFSLLSSEDQQAVKRDVGELLLLMARSRFIQSAYFGKSREERAFGIRRSLALNDAAREYLDWSAIQLQERVMSATLHKGSVYTLAAEDFTSDAVPVDTGDALLTASTLMLLGEYDASLPILNEITRREPKFLWGWWLRANGEESIDKLQQAKDSYDNCIVLDPQFAAAYYRRANCLFRLHRYYEVIDDCTTLIEREKSSEAYLNRARAYMALERFDDAIEDLKIALLGVRTKATAHRLLADCFDQIGDHSSASHYRLLMETSGLSDVEPRQLFEQAKVLTTEERYLEALAIYEQLEAFGPRKHRKAVLMNKAILLAEKMHDERGAIKALDALLEQEPANTNLQLERALLLARMGERELALQAIAHLTKEPLPPQAAYKLGCIYSLTSKQSPDDVPTAINFLQQALFGGYGLQKFRSDADLKPLRQSPLFAQIEVQLTGARQ